MSRLLPKRFVYEPLLILSLVLICQAAGYYFRSSGISIINDRQLFGLAGSNSGAIIVSLLLLAILVYWYAKSQLWPLLLIFIGGASNLIDRILYSGTIDYINLPMIPLFNLADVVIVIGAIFLLCKAVHLTKKSP